MQMMICIFFRLLLEKQDQLLRIAHSASLHDIEAPPAEPPDQPAAQASFKPGPTC